MSGIELHDMLACVRLPAVERLLELMQRVKVANDRMTKATWALVLATVVEVCVTVGQVVVAVLHH